MMDDAYLIVNLHAWSRKGRRSRVLCSELVEHLPQGAPLEGALLSLSPLYDYILV